MNWKNFLLAAFGLTAAGLLASCTGFETARSGEVIRNPSVDEMDRLHDQWGMPRRQVKPRYRPAMPGDFRDDNVSQPASGPVPVQPQTPGPATAPALQEPPPEPIPSPVPDAPAPSTTSPTPIPDNLR